MIHSSRVPFTDTRTKSPTSESPRGGESIHHGFYAVARLRVRTRRFCTPLRVSIVWYTSPFSKHR